MSSSPPSGAPPSQDGVSAGLGSSSPAGGLAEGSSGRGGPSSRVGEGPRSQEGASVGSGSARGLPSQPGSASSAGGGCLVGICSSPPSSSRLNHEGVSAPSSGARSRSPRSSAGVLKMLRRPLSVSSSAGAEGGAARTSEGGAGAAGRGGGGAGATGRGGVGVGAMSSKSSAVIGRRRAPQCSHTATFGGFGRLHIGQRTVSPAVSG